MRTKQRSFVFLLVALIGSGLHLAASADETESTGFEGATSSAPQVDASRPPHMVYIPGQGRPPAFAPSSASADGDPATRPAALVQDDVRVYGDSWIERHRRAAQGNGPGGFASAR